MVLKLYWEYLVQHMGNGKSIPGRSLPAWPVLLSLGGSIHFLCFGIFFTRSRSKKILFAFSLQSESPLKVWTAAFQARQTSLRGTVNLPSAYPVVEPQG